jgi:hypothetical protein
MVNRCRSFRGLCASICQCGRISFFPDRTRCITFVYVYSTTAYLFIYGIPRLPESWDRKIWSWVPRDPKPRMTVLARTSSRSADRLRVDAISGSDCTAPNGRMITVMNCKGCGRKLSWYNFRLYPDICAKEVTKIIRNLSYDSEYPRRDMNPAPSNTKEHNCCKK